MNLKSLIEIIKMKNGKENSEALLIKQYRPILNVQEQSIQLKFLNQFIPLRGLNC